MSSAGSSVAAASAAVVTGVLYALSLDIGPFGALALVAPIPVLLLALGDASARRVALTAAAARLIGCAGLVYAYGGTIPTAVLIVMALLLTAHFTSAVLLARWCARRLPSWLAVFAFAIFAAALEFLMLLPAPDGTFGAMGYALVDILPLAQLASVGGVAALTFLAGFVPMALAVLLRRRREWRSIAVAAGVPLAFVLVFGAWRLAQPYERSVRVGLAAIDELTLQALQGDDAAAEVAQRYAMVLAAFESQDLDFIVLPERMFADRADEIAAGSAPLLAAANALDVTIVAGFDETLADGRHANTARLFTPTGNWSSYAKRRLIPGLEANLVPGDRPMVIDGVGVAICKDMDFPRMIREYGREGATLMLVPAWDFVVDGRLHSRMAVLRAIENGFAMARAAASGRLTVNDAYGRIVAEAVTTPSAPAVLTAEVGLTSLVRPLYVRIGDLFAWLTVAGALVLVALCRVCGRVPRDEQAR
jgi:Apolipoprotein N-acyltransferase